MKLSNETVELLKNFATINQGIVFKAGNRLRTISILTNIFAVADIPDTIPRDFAVYDLNEFLSTLSLFGGNADIEYKDDHILIKSGSSKVKYFYSSPNVVVAPPDRDVQLTDPELEFELTAADLGQIMKASSALKLKELSITNGSLTALNKQGIGNQISIDVEMTAHTSSNVERLVNIENLKLSDGAYDVRVFSNAVEFKHKVKPGLVYLVSVESVS